MNYETFSIFLGTNCPEFRIDILWAARIPRKVVRRGSKAPDWKEEDE
jgi:hypothetical protein